MKYRTATLMARTDLGASGTKIQDIYLTDPISALYFYYEITTVSGAMLRHPTGAIDKIEIVDGSDVLLSLSGEEAHAMHFFDAKELDAGAPHNIEATALEGTLTVLFGRKLWDTELAFDAKKFTNPQLRITYDVTAVQDAATNLYLTILALCFDEKAISPIGFLQDREFHKFTMDATEAYTYVQLPTDLIIRKLLMRPATYGKTVVNQLEEARLDEDNEKKIPFNVSALNLAMLQRGWWGMCREAVIGQGRGSSLPIFIAACAGNVATLANISGKNAMQLVQWEGGRAAVLTDAGTDYVIGWFEGYCPHHCIAYPFGMQDDIEDWYDPTGLKSLRLRYLSASTCPSAAVCSTILQQLRRY